LFHYQKHIYYKNINYYYTRKPVNESKTVTRLKVSSRDTT